MPNDKWKMFRSDSMRLRLTLWYTGVLALVLIFFVVGTYAYLARAARARDDQSLRDTANSLISDFETEMNDERQRPDAAAAEVTGTFQSRIVRRSFLTPTARQSQRPCRRPNRGVCQAGRRRLRFRKMRVSPRDRTASM